MIPRRVIPCLLLRHSGLVKTVQFRDPVYLGDPINIVRIFNEKEADELILLDTTATLEGRSPAFGIVEKLAGECFMPLCYGGGVRSTDDMKRLFQLGVEKVALNSMAVERPELVRTAADLFGSQSVVVSIDVRRRPFGRYEVCSRGGTQAGGRDPAEFATAMEREGAGELLVTSIDRDGTMQGYDLDLLRHVTGAVGLPVIACGGAGRLEHLVAAVRDGGASAAAAGSLFVFQGKHRAVLISYPGPAEIDAAFRGSPS